MERVPIQPRWYARQGMEVLPHLRAIDDDQDRFQTAIADLNNSIKFQNKILIGILSTTASASALLAANVISGTLGF